MKRGSFKQEAILYDGSPRGDRHTTVLIGLPCGGSSHRRNDGVLN